MKVYFISSPRGVAKEKEDHKDIYFALEELGHNNLTDFVITVDAEKFYLSDVNKFYEKTIQDLKHADVCVFETSTPSLAVGQLLAIALQYGKPVIALYKNDNEPFFLTGVPDEKIQIIKYDIENIKSILSKALNYAQDQADTRFNFFISPSLAHYLDWISQKKKIPRSVYLRQLIEQDREKNTEYFES